jgi:hypothetical protein
MSVTLILGIIIWIVAILLGISTIQTTKISNSIVIVIVIVVGFPLVGFIFSLIGLLGIIFVAPLMELLGWNSFIITNF